MAKPQRVAFELEGEWLAAVLTWLERRHPHDTAARAAHWARIDTQNERQEPQTTPTWLGLSSSAQRSSIASDIRWYRMSVESRMRPSASTLSVPA